MFERMPPIGLEYVLPLKWNLILFSIILVVRYFILAGGAYWWLYVRGAQKFAARKIDPKPPSRAIMKSEIKWSLVSSIVFAIGGAIGLEFYRMGWTLIYFDPAQHGWFYLIALQLPLLMFLHETYFYFAHRAVHHPKLFWIHRVHHESFNPTPWSAFSFSTSEAILEAIYLPVIILLMPIHPAVFLVFLAVMSVWGVLNHTGYEFYPPGFYRTWWGKWLIGATDHFVHHRKVTYNFGLYFTFWDHWLGTYDPKFLDFFDKVTDRANSSRSTPHAPQSRDLSHET